MQFSKRLGGVCIFILDQNENVPSKENIIERLMSIIPIDQLKDTPLNVITKEDFVNHFFAEKVVVVKETLRPMGIIRVAFDENQTQNKIFCEATSIDGIIMRKEEAVISYIKNNMIYVERKA